MVQPVTILNPLSLFLLGVWVGALTHALTFLLSGWGVRRPTDMVALLAFISILLPGLSMEGQAWISSILDWVIPPYRSTVALSGAIRLGDLPETAEALVRIMGYAGASLGLGYLGICRWMVRP